MSRQRIRSWWYRSYGFPGEVTNTFVELFFNREPVILWSFAAEISKEILVWWSHFWHNFDDRTQVSPPNITHILVHVTYLGMPSNSLAYGQLRQDPSAAGMGANAQSSTIKLLLSCISGHSFSHKKKKLIWKIDLSSVKFLYSSSTGQIQHYIRWKPEENIPFQETPNYVMPDNLAGSDPLLQLIRVLQFDPFVIPLY